MPWQKHPNDYVVDALLWTAMGEFAGIGKLVSLTQPKPGTPRYKAERERQRVETLSRMDRLADRAIKLCGDDFKKLGEELRRENVDALRSYPLAPERYYNLVIGYVKYPPRSKVKIEYFCYLDAEEVSAAFLQRHGNKEVWKEAKERLSQGERVALVGFGPDYKKMPNGNKPVPNVIFIRSF